jgi:hypothetical protein
MKPQLDIQNNLKRYFPSLFEVLEDGAISWASINKSFIRELEKRKARMEPGQQTIMVKANLYDVITASDNGNQQAARLLDFFSKLFEELGKRLSSADKKKLHTTVFNILVNLDWTYLNYLGELATLNQLIKSGGYQFLGTEVNLGNGKGGDFDMLELKTNLRIIIEVVNIMLPENLQGDDEKIKRFLTTKLTDKMNDKTKQGQKTSPFTLVPVIWGGQEQLRRISNFYKTNTIEVPHCLEAGAYSTFIKSDGSFFHCFGRISTLFSGEQTYIS